MTTTRISSGYRDLRKGRRSIPGQSYLVTTVTANRKPILDQLEMARIIVHALRFSDARQWSNTLAFVIMPDHVHWLFELEGRRSLERLIGSLKSWTSVEARKRLSISGRLWQAGFHDRAIRKEESLVEVSRYIVGNPLRAGLAEDIGDYPHWDAVWLER